jgi:GrpB-like predicted nucleotidyltransferase (UPF0157 family)
VSVATDLPAPLTEEQIRASTVGELTPHDAPIELAEYDPVWPEIFEAEERKIRGALGEAAREVHHVGSTSVPGLAAKPIVDVCLVVPDSADEEAYLPAILALGYELRVREPEWFEHRLVRRFDPRVQVHIYSEGCEEIDRYLRFRDRLRADPGDRALYERTKRELAARRWRYVQNYADAKTAVVHQILARAGG